MRAGLDDGPEYSPDGQWIYFNSTRSGQMQIWRMKPDGTSQERVTNDHKCNDWFPHFSPDGKWIVDHLVRARRRADEPPVLQALLPAHHADGRQRAAEGDRRTCTAARARSTCRRGHRTARTSRSSRTPTRFNGDIPDLLAKGTRLDSTDRDLLHAHQLEHSVRSATLPMWNPSKLLSRIRSACTRSRRAAHAPGNSLWRCRALRFEPRPLC